jgi:trk system potassium uptake protein TrkA
VPGVDTRVAAIFRRGKGIVPKGDRVIEADDEVFFIAAREHIKTVMSELRRLDKSARRIMLAGGGNIGHRLARALESKHQVKVLEHNAERAKYLAEKLDKAIILHGDSADEELLLEENIDQMDVFCSLTNADEANILSAMLAKKLGAKKVMSLINSPAYVDLIENQENIDVAISPQQITIGVLLTHVRRGDVVAVHSLRRGAAEAIEIVAHGDTKTSRVVGRRVEEVVLPEGTSIGAIVRGDEVMMAHHDLEIQTDDHLIIFLLDKHKIPLVEKLFQVSVSFF